MPYTNHWEKDGLYRKFTGKITGYEILESNFGLQVQPAFKAIKYIINDFTEVTGHAIEKEHTDIYAETDKRAAEKRASLKIAILVTQPEQIVLAEGYRAEMKDNQFICEIFQTMKDARDWASN
ncbi:MAG: hypothetical protein OEZ15_02215 [Gammaproteobacteria bacterium]|nr:hypothetical protein [Gammaproteobacteria bacterium]